MAEDKTKTENTENLEILNDADANEKTTQNISDKQSLIKKILIVAIALLTIFLILIIILLSNKTQEEEITDINNSTIQVDEQSLENQEIVEVEEEEFKFDFKKLDPEKLNEQLELLTNKNLEQEALKIDNDENQEKNRSYASGIFLEDDELNNIEKEDETIKNDDPKVDDNTVLDQSEENQDEEDIVISNNTKNNNQEAKDDKNPTITVNNGLILILNKNDENINKESENVENSEEEKDENVTIDNLSLVNLINVAKIKGNLQKKYYDKIYKIDSSLILCRDNQNNIEIYFGPFSDASLQKELLSKLLNAGFTESYSLEMSEEEFNKRCKY